MNENGSRKGLQTFMKFSSFPTSVEVLLFVFWVMVEQVRVRENCPGLPITEAGGTQIDVIVRFWRPIGARRKLSL
jgi:hypothetical protein